MNAPEFLKRSVDGFAAYLLPNGELMDPVLREPTQYGNLQLASSVKNIETHTFFNLGMGIRPHAGRAELQIMAQQDMALTQPITQSERAASLELAARPGGLPFTYHLSVAVDPETVHIQEQTPDLSGYKTLLIPYVRDAGTGAVTQGERVGDSIELTLDREQLIFTFHQPIEFVLNLPHGFENRRGLCGLLRIDFQEQTGGLNYEVRAAARGI